MNHVFWIGVYPGLTEEMLDYVAGVITEFVSNLVAAQDEAQVVSLLFSPNEQKA
jgi:hypothetical protein